MASNTPGAPAFTLTKEEKEALLEKKMEVIQKKNAALKKRHQEIEADRKAAEMSGRAVNPKLQTSTAPLSPKKDMKGVGEDGHTDDHKSAWAAGRGKRLKSNQEKQNKDDSKEAKRPGRDIRDNRDGRDGKAPPRESHSPRDTYSPRESHPPRDTYSPRDSHPLARDVGPQNDGQNDWQNEGQGPVEDGRPPSGPNRLALRLGRGGGGGPRGGARGGGARGGKLPIPARNSNSPPPDPGFSFLSDRGRQGPVPTERPRRGRDGEAFRHPRNFGGTDFNDVRSKMRAVKERGQGRHIRGGHQTPDLEVMLTGRERREYIQWKEEREKIDQARIDRQKAATGMWKREWDADKDENFEPPPPCPPSPKHMTPHRRLGRIGSGRFQHAQLAAAAAADRAVVSLPGALRQGGRGTGRGRGYRDKASSPAPGRLRLRKASTSSDDRSVDAHQNSLVIQIDNEYAKAAAESMLHEKKVHFRVPNGNRGRPDASPATRARRGRPDASPTARGRRGEQPANNRGGGRRAGVGSGRLRPGSSWQPQDQEEYWEDEGAIMPLVSDTQPPIKPKATKPRAKPKTTTAKPAPGATDIFTDISTAAEVPAAEVPVATNGTSEETKNIKPEATEKVAKTEKKVELPDDLEMIHVNEEDLDDDDDDQWLDIDDPQDFYDMRHGNLGDFSDDEDAHNSSAESLERFIQEHTLRIDKDTGLAAQTPPESQNSQTSQTSQTSQGSGKADRSLNNSRGSVSDRGSPSKIGNLSDSEYEAALSPSEHMGAVDAEESADADASEEIKTVQNNENESESGQNKSEQSKADEEKSEQQPCAQSANPIVSKIIV